jgi:hypothetical protein
LLFYLSMQKQHLQSLPRVIFIAGGNGYRWLLQRFSKI